jgi:hypothetical protein
LAALAAFSFLIFNLLCAPCFAAVGAIRREMNSWKWTFFALGYQTVLAYSFSLVIYQVGSIFLGGFGATNLALSIVGLVAALIVLSVAIIAASFAIYRLSSSDTLALSCGAVGEIILLFIYFISPERLEGSLAKIFSCLAVTERLESFTASAILDLSSIIYFITVSALFVFFTHEVSEKARLG